jgi:hypothetical protein
VDVVSPRNNEAWVTPEHGGLLRATDERILLRVPPGAVAGRTRFTYAPEVVASTTDVPNPPPGLRLAFRLAAQDKRGQAVRQFPAALELTMVAPPDRGGLHLYYYEETTQRWIAVPTQRRPHRAQWQARLDHLTLFAGVSGEDPVMPSGMPSIRGIQSDLFTGAATINYEIPLPPGAGSFAPRLTMQFNSRERADSGGAISVLGAGWHLSVDSWVATGWFLAGSSTDKPTIWRIDGISYTEQGDTFREAPDWRLTHTGSGWSDVAARTDFPGSKAANDACNPDSYDAKAKQYFYTDRLLRGINIRQLRSDRSGYDIVAAYKLDYEHWGPADCRRSQRYALHTVTRCSGFTGTGWSGCLPAMTFNNAEQAPDSSGWLSQVDNGYSGRMVFEHTSSYSWAVTKKTVSDATTGQTDAWTYDYGSGSNEVHNSDGVVASTTTVGFKEVTETLLPPSLGSGNTIYTKRTLKFQTAPSSMSPVGRRTGSGYPRVCQSPL